MRPTSLLAPDTGPIGNSEFARNPICQIPRLSVVGGQGRFEVDGQKVEKDGTGIKARTARRYYQNLRRSGDDTWSVQGEQGRSGRRWGIDSKGFRRTRKTIWH